jgi:hypothetical protein
MGQSASIDAANRTVKITVACGTNLAALTPEFTLSPAGTTAKIGSTAQTSGVTPVNCAAPVTYTLSTAEGVTAQWTITVKVPDDCPTVKKYITYNQPVTAYYIEYNGGMKTANQNGDAGYFGNVVEAYALNKYAYIMWSSSDNDWGLNYYTPNNGSGIFSYFSVYGSGYWDKYEDPTDEGRFSTHYHGYPLGEFAAYVSNYKGNTDRFYGYGLSLYDIATSNNYDMPNHTDVTRLYVRSEKVGTTTCDVYQDRDETYRVNLTFWVDPATGFTMKYKCVHSDNSVDEYEVTRLVVGALDWDGLHLHPKAGDTIIEP